jgi:y4mF family transcriptional regulator
LTGANNLIIFPIRNMQIIANSSELGAAIRSERKRLGVRQKELAMAAGTGLRFLIELERGKPTARMDGVFKVLRALGGSLAIETTEADESPRSEEARLERSERMVALVRACENTKPPTSDRP